MGILVCTCVNVYVERWVQPKLANSPTTSGSWKRVNLSRRGNKTHQFFCQCQPKLQVVPHICCCTCMLVQNVRRRWYLLLLREGLVEGSWPDISLSTDRGSYWVKYLAFTMQPALQKLYNIVALPNNGSCGPQSSARCLRRPSLPPCRLRFCVHLVQVCQYTHPH